MTGKSITTGALAILVAGAVVFITDRQSGIASARADNQALQPDYEEAAQLADENKQIERLRAENQEIKRLEKANEELPKLRNEATQLQHQVDGLHDLQAENQLLAVRQTAKSAVNSVNLNDMPDRRQMMGNVFPREELRDVGTGFPRATLQTLFYAMCAGNMQRVRDCFTPESLANASDDSLRRETSQMMGSFTSYEIADRKVSDNEIDFTVKMNPSGQTQVMRFKNLGSDWKLSR